MKLRLPFCFLIPLSLVASGQNETYTIKKASFSSDLYDEFSPVYYRNGIVFCTSRGQGMSNYSDGQNRSPFKINYIDTTRKVKWQAADVLSKDLTTRLNEGPATFSSNSDTIYFSRNLNVDPKKSKLLGMRNKLGIFSAVKMNGKWGQIQEFRFNNEWYNVTTPYLSPDGRRLYFASDKPGGYGGLDLYYCQLKNDYWDNPINLGPVVNTESNEAYPFINQAGELFFSSDGHPGLGGKDIFFSRQKNGNWLIPDRLDSPVNSQYDDFGITTDSLNNEGYFSSKRDNSVDIYKFKTNFPQILGSDILKENQYCFNFSDEGAIKIDTLNLYYVWDFGDGEKASEAVVNHCFPGPGKYNVKLDIVDRATGKLFFSKLSYTLEIRDFEQPYINSPYTVVAGDPVDFDGLKSFLPGYKILSYSWDFGDGSRMQGGSVKYTFKQSGEFYIKLGLKIKSLSNGIIHNMGVTKKITVVSSPEAKAALLSKNASVNTEFPDVRNLGEAVTTQFSAEKEFSQDAEFQIELLSSDIRLGIKNNIFKNLTGKYAISEVFEPEAGIYSYIVDRQMNLMATYTAYKELIRLGFKDIRVKVNIIKDPVDKELFNLEKNYGNLTDNFFDAYNSLSGNGYLLLDQIVILMNRYPDIRLEVGVHTDNTGLPAKNLTLSQTRSQVMVDYLIKRGISAKRLIVKSYGGTNPVASNMYEKERKLNRRVDFRVID